ncbi:MAG: hypothetical protein ACKN9U_15800 [Pirellulaceae bacterium]
MLVRPLAAVPLRLPIALLPQLRLPLLPAAVAVAAQVSWLASMPERLPAAVLLPLRIAHRLQLLSPPAVVQDVVQASWPVSAPRKPRPAAVQLRLPPAVHQLLIAAVALLPRIAAVAVRSAPTAAVAAMQLPTAADAVAP